MAKHEVSDDYDKDDDVVISARLLAANLKSFKISRLQASMIMALFGIDPRDVDKIFDSVKRKEQDGDSY
jgi:hypothetical protein